MEQEILSEIKKVKTIVIIILLFWLFSILLTIGAFGYGYFIAGQQEAITTTEQPKNSSLSGNETLLELLQTKNAYEDYEKYKAYESHKAFAVNGQGTYGWTYGYLSERLAVTNALNFCEESNRASQPKCFVVDINGKFVYPDYE